jgi:hypothetical protein
VKNINLLTVIIEVMRLKLFILLLLCVSLVVHGQQKPCGKIFYERLTTISQKTKISDQDFKESVNVVKKLDSINCHEYDVIINGQEYCESSLTFLFGVICVKFNCTNAVIEFIKYINFQSGSAEEEIDFSLERLFKKRPEDVLKYGGSYLDKLAWGFVNNHYYGVVDPYENELNKAFTKYDNPPKVVLTKKNYKDIFYQVNPKLKPEYDKYQSQIDNLLNSIFENLEDIDQ